MRFIRIIGLVLLLIGFELSEVFGMSVDTLKCKKKLEHWEQVLQRNQYFKELPAYADSIFNTACQLKLYQRAANALQAKLNYFRQISSASDREKYEKITAESIQFCDKHNLVASSRRMRYFLVDYYAKCEFYQEAILENNRLLADAPKNLQDEALLSWNQRMGNIYYTQRRLSLARKSYMKAGELSMKQKLYRRAYSCFHMVGNCSVFDGDYESALKAADLTYKSVRMDKTLNAVNDSVLRVLEWVDKGLCYYNLNRKQEFSDVIDSLERYPFLSLDKTAKNYYLEVRALGYLSEGNLEQAEVYSDSIRYYEIMLDAYRAIYTKTGNYKKLALTQDKFLKIPLQRLKKIHSMLPLLENNLVKMNEIQMERTRLDQSNQRLLLQTYLAHEQQEKNRAELYYLEQENKLDESNHEAMRVAKQHEIGRVKRSILQHESADARALLQKRSQKRYVILSTLSLITFGLLLFVFYHRRYIKSLHHEELETERARSEAEMHLNQATEHLKTAVENDEIKTRFIESISHEVRTPLNAIVGFSSLLIDENMTLTPEEKKEYALQVEKSSVLLSTLVNGILDLANLTTGKYKMVYAPTSVYDLMNSLQAYAQTHKKESVRLQMDLEEIDEVLMLETDFQRLLQAAKALVDNAFDFTESGSVLLRASVVDRDAKEWLQLSVTDTGIGIPEGLEEVIFQRFKKLDEFSGSCGLGLTVARTIVEILGGRCYLDTTYHQSGSRFVIDVPMKR